MQYMKDQSIQKHYKHSQDKKNGLEFERETYSKIKLVKIELENFPINHKDKSKKFVKYIIHCIQIMYKLELEFLKVLERYNNKIDNCYLFMLKNACRNNSHAIRELLANVVLFNNPCTRGAAISVHKTLLEYLERLESYVKTLNKQIRKERTENNGLHTTTRES